jgi:hypothetical protein
VAAKKKQTSKKNVPRGAQALVIFWLIFVIVIIAVFMANSGTIKKNFNLFKTRITTSPNTMEEEPLSVEEPIVTVVVEERPATPPAPTPTAPPPAAETPAKPAEQKPLVTPTPPPVNPPAPPPPAPPAPQTRDRAVYFAQVDKDGQILQSRVSRRITVSETPMQDVLVKMLEGPTAEELNKGVLNLIPRNTRLLSATVRGNTAYLSFSDDFMLNTFGVEGYVAQLRQIVWTVTEFQNVNDVQILIEGRRLDYLAEGIWIGSPISRSSF